MDNPHFLMDPHGRRITYLRLSVTDRCNLRCRYCIPPGGWNWIDHDAILRYEEMLRIVRLMAGMGVEKVRVTGGEPLVRKNLAHLIRGLKQIPGICEVTLTTNGTLLADRARELKAAGVDRINISLDTLDPNTFRMITGRDQLDQVFRGIKAAREAGMTPVKINAVPMVGVNDKEIEDLAALSFKEGIHVRFIEQMPIGIGMGCTEQALPLTMETLKNQIEEIFGTLEELPKRPGSGPADPFRIPGAKGEIGFIHAVSRHFCATCNRIRLTADGRLRPCLLDDTSIDIKTGMRQGMGDDRLVSLIREAVHRKRKARDLSHGVSTRMNAIGG